MVVGTCKPTHDFWAAALSTFIAIGLIVSYLPQHLRIINKGSSQGLSPWFLLLGSTGNASAMYNVIALQWAVIQCCPHVGAGSCLESLGAVIQVVLQWFLYTFILVLFIIYFPSNLKYVDVVSHPEAHSERTESHEGVRSAEWKLAATLSWVVAIHWVFITFVTFLLLLPSHGSGNPSPMILQWATFLGVTSTALTIVQYAPQIWATWKAGTVGALSIPMMCIQTPGAVLMVAGIVIRPGTNWTSWAAYAAAGFMQGILLTMCLVWTVRQKRLGIDDFGKPLWLPQDGEDTEYPIDTSAAATITPNTEGGEREPLLKR